MRRKSARNASKASPEKPVKEVETPPKTRRSRRRKRSPSKSSESEEEVIRVTRRAPVENTPDTTTKSHSPSDEETSQEPVWKVTSSDDAPRGEIQKLKICLTRPVSESPDKLKARRSKSRSQTEDDATTSSEDKSSATTATTTPRQTRSRGSPFAATEEDVDEKKGKGKSKGKHKSKIEQSAHLNDENEMPSMNIEISENAQVTPLSPTIDKPVDIENDRKNKVADGDDRECVIENAETESEGKIGDCTNQPVGRLTETDNKTEDIVKLRKSNKQDDDEDEDEPLSVIQKVVREEKQDKVEPVEREIEIPRDEQVPQTQSIIQGTEEQPEVVEKVEEQPEVVKKLEEQPKVIDKLEEQPEVVHKLEEQPEVVEKVTVQSEVVEKLEETKAETVQEDAQPTTEVIAETVPETVVDIPEIRETPQLDEEEPMDISTDVSFSIQIPKETLETETESNKVEEKPEEQPMIVAESKVQTTNQTIDKKEDEEEDGEIKSTESLLEDAPKAKVERKIRKRLIRRDLLNEKESILSETKSDELKKWTFSFDACIKIDLESLTALYPNIEFPAEADLVVIEPKERRRSQALSAIEKLERSVSIDTSSDVAVTSDSEDKSNIIAFNRKISIVDDTASKLKPPPSPAKNPIADVLYITNLVRPFTLKQLKELLERTGKIRDDGFWTDRIKSKCYVHYETQEEAEATRNALHGVQWPIGNGKKLMIEYATVEDLENAKNPPQPQPTTPTAVLPDTKVSLKENVEPLENKPRHEDSKSKDDNRKKEAPVREWDIGKELQRDRSRSRDRNRKHRRSATPIEDFISKKHRKEEEAVPVRLMDDLFLKTKATPSIYWQPLSPEEIAMKQQQRLVRMEEHKRRMEENSRMKGRDYSGRGANFRRRYD